MHRNRACRDIQGEAVQQVGKIDVELIAGRNDARESGGSLPVPSIIAATIAPNCEISTRSRPRGGFSFGGKNLP